MGYSMTIRVVKNSISPDRYGTLQWDVAEKVWTTLDRACGKMWFAVQLGR